MLPQYTPLIEVDLVDGAALDVASTQPQLVEAFDTLKNEHHPEAKTFIVYQAEAIGNLVAVTPYEAIRDALNATDPGAWLELNTKAGNRTMVRRNLIVNRGSHPDSGAVVTININGQYVGMEVTETIHELREIMSGPPPGVVQVQPVAPMPEPDPAEPEVVALDD